jgi:hypothetical protein
LGLGVGRGPSGRIESRRVREGPSTTNPEKPNDDGREKLERVRTRENLEREGPSTTNPEKPKREIPSTTADERTLNEIFNERSLNEIFNERTLNERFSHLYQGRTLNEIFNERTLREP